jgi:hypothetical protein
LQARPFNCAGSGEGGDLVLAGVHEPRMRGGARGDGGQARCR